MLAEDRTDGMNRLVPAQPLVSQPFERFDNDLFTKSDLVLDNNVDGDVQPIIRKRNVTTTMVRGDHLEPILFRRFQPVGHDWPDVRIVFFQNPPFFALSPANVLPLSRERRLRSFRTAGVSRAPLVGCSGRSAGCGIQKSNHWPSSTLLEAPVPIIMFVQPCRSAMEQRHPPKYPASGTI